MAACAPSAHAPEAPASVSLRRTPVVTPTAASATPTVVPPGHACAPPYPAEPATPETVFCTNPSSMERARVLRIVDGDTIHVELDGRDEAVRFYGINATERRQPCSEEATERTRELAGDEVRLRPDARASDRFGRLLRYVYSPSGLSIDAELVDEGLAHAWREDGALRDAIVALEAGAQARHAGCLWR